MSNAINDHDITRSCDHHSIIKSNEYVERYILSIPSPKTFTSTYETPPSDFKESKQYDVEVRPNQINSLRTINRRFNQES